MANNSNNSIDMTMVELLAEFKSVSNSVKEIRSIQREFGSLETLTSELGKRFATLEQNLRDDVNDLHEKINKAKEELSSAVMRCKSVEDVAKKLDLDLKSVIKNCDTRTAALYKRILEDVRKLLPPKEVKSDTEFKEWLKEQKNRYWDIKKIIYTVLGTICAGIIMLILSKIMFPGFIALLREVLK